MADGSTTISFATPSLGSPRLADSLGRHRHLVARCTAPQCRRSTPCDPAPWFAQGLGDLPLPALAERLRCVCGARRAELEIRSGPFLPVAHPDLFIFR